MKAMMVRGAFTVAILAIISFSPAQCAPADIADNDEVMEDTDLKKDATKKEQEEGLKHLLSTIGGEMNMHLSDLDVTKMIPTMKKMTSLLHKHHNLHEKPGNRILKKVYGQRTKKELVSTMKNMYGDVEVDEDEISQQLDAITGLMQQMKRSPDASSEEILKSAISKLGLELDDDIMETVQKQMGWMKPLIEKITPMFIDHHEEL